jgi:hypothetical protein
MTQIIAVSKKYHDVLTETNPNNFIFHSEYNTFKIVKQGTHSVNIPASTLSTDFTLAHGMWYLPLVHAFALYSTDICLPNEKLYSPIGSDVWTFAFDELKSDINNIIFTVSNNSGSQINVTFRYYIFEVPL